MIPGLFVVTLEECVSKQIIYIILVQFIIQYTDATNLCIANIGSACFAFTAICFA